MGRTLRLLVCAILVCPPAALAQRFDEVGVRAQGMAGAFVAVADDATATWWNPAGLATSLRLVDLSAEVTRGGGRGVAFGFPSLGLSYYRLKISQIQPFGSTAAPGSGRQENGAAGSGLPAVDVGLSQFGVTVGQSISPHLVVATTVKLVSAQSDTQADLDVGAMAAFGVIRLGVTVRNVRNPTFGSGIQAFDAGRRARAGAAAVLTGGGWLGRAVFAVDADVHSTGASGAEEQDVAGGVETWWLRGRLAVRAGGGTDRVGGGGSFGAFGVTVVPYPRVNVEGAVTRGADSARDRWSLGLRLAF